MQPTFSLPNTAIGASAGSGKTFQLAHRYVGLLLAGFAPERIVALTFSRKAAGEMFDRIIQALCAGAESEAGTAELLQNLRTSQAVPTTFNLDRNRVLECLRNTLEVMHRTRVGTLDSFFTGVLQAFPFEFGLGGEIAILEGHQETAARRKTLAAVLGDMSAISAENHTAAPDALAEFIEDFKQATYGQDDKSFTAQIDEFIDRAGNLFAEARDAEQWGNEQRIWPTPSPWLSSPAPPLESTVGTMREQLQSLELDDRQTTKLNAFLDAAETFRGGSITPLGDLLDKLIEVMPDLRSGTAEIMLYKKLHLSGDIARTAADVVHAVMTSVLTSRLQATRGVHNILKRFDAYYDDRVRRNGMLTFSDVLTILAGGHELTAHDDPEGDRLYVDYRLDAHFDHWLLDEFQDTSTLQWKVLKNLADEVLQDNSGERSLFYVGDVKQAIYGWRGGDARLFDAIRTPYKDHIELRCLTQSFRSSQPVIDAVNAVFDRFPERMTAHDLADPIPDTVLERWENAWGGRHQTAKKDLPGFVQLIAVERPKKNDPLNSIDRRMRVLVAELQHLNPETGGLSVGVLVRTNKTAATFADFLRENGFDVALEGAFPLTDNTVVAAFRSLIKATLHPDDSFAVQHLRMTPWHNKFNATDNAAERIQNTLDTIHRHGFQALAREWIDDVRDTFDEFAENRAENLLQAAGEFDAAGNRNLADFIDFIDAYEVADTADSAALKVMTIHKSKGLQFDAVFLPDIDGGTGMNNARRSSFLIRRKDDLEREIDWILDAPPKTVIENDPALRDCQDRLAEDACYEELCTLYVAMTRAKHALYIIQDQPSTSAKTLHPSTLVRLALAGTEPIDTRQFDEFSAEIEHRTGNPDWADDARARHRATPPRPAPSPLLDPNAPASSRPRRLTPSGSEEVELSAGRLFHATSGIAAAVGDLLHSVMSELEWLDKNQTTDSILRTSQNLASPIHPAIRDRTICELRKLLGATAVRQALACPAATAEVWREKRFEVLLDGGWVSGCFDRVVLIRNESAGTVERAVIQDYKTSRIADDHAQNRVIRTYAPQMAVYRAALARIQRIPESKILCQLLLTDTGAVVDMPPSFKT